MNNLEYRQLKDPSLKQKMLQIENFTQRKIQQNKKYQGKVDGQIITIPVVVHVIYKNSQENISTAQIQSQIDVLNEDFRRTNADADNTWSQAADTQIEFKLATIDVNGNPTTGITRKSSNKSSWGTQDAMKKSSEGGVDPWDTSEYLNMWVCNIGGGILGYAQFPGGSAATDGVVMSPQYFGSSDKGTGFYLSAPFDKGRTATHEVGHFLNLRHIWGDGGCGIDDFVSDTPESDKSNYGCATGHNSCGSLDMVQNYMDYSDDACMNLFTQGQKNRMRAVLETGGVRRALALSDKFDTPVVCNATVPTGISIAGITTSDASVSWSEVTGATYDVRYKAVSASSWITSEESTTTKLLSGLSASTEYEVQVRSKCTSGNSPYSTSTNFTTVMNNVSYCTSKGNSVSDEYIQKVVVGNINNTSTGGNGYSDHTSITTDLIKGELNTITITPKWVGTVYSEAYAVFIDYNQDGDFNDAGETVWTKSASKTTPVSGSFTVPSSATNGSTRMRVAMKYNGIPDSCETFSYGEVEDYTVIVSEALADVIAPSSPTDLTASNVTQTTLTINWTASTDNVGVTEYEVYQGGIKIGSTANTTINVTGLIAATDYSFWAYAKDAAGNISKRSYTLNVTTLPNQVSYCSSKGNSVRYEWIDYVAFGGMTNTSGANGGYGDFTSKVATVAQGSTNQLVVRAGFSTSNYNEYFTIWIDYNRDGDFNDAGEQVVAGNSSSIENRITDVVIPSNATLGQTRMRVSMKYNSAPTSCEANLGDGEVEDYTVNIINSAVNNRNSIVTGEKIGSQEVVELMAYPNPSIDFIHVKLASKSDKITYKIINAIGSTVQSGRLNSSRLNISKLNTGMYMLKVNDGQKVLTTRLLKK